jgi:hypothetical protein
MYLMTSVIISRIPRTFFANNLNNRTANSLTAVHIHRLKLIPKTVVVLQIM